MAGLKPAVWEERARLLLAALQENRELSMAKAYREAGLKFTHWRRIAAKVPWFRETYMAEKEARGSVMTRGGPPGTPPKYELRAGNEDKIDLFFRFWPEEGTINKACKRVNREVTTGTTLWPELIMRRINSSNKDFDVAFFERFKEVEGAMNARVYDGIAINATTPDEKRGTPGGNPQSQKLWHALGGINSAISLMTPT